MWNGQQGDATDPVRVLFDPETIASRVVMQSHTMTYISFRPRGVTIFTEKKSVAHSVFA